MAAEIELKKINEYVQECIAITSITGAYVYGIDSNGNSIKIAVEVLASAGTDYSQQIAALTTKCNNNTTLITALQTAVNGKANAVHTHQISDVANLQTALDGKSNTGHTHVISDVAGLQTALNGKAEANHTHGMSAIVGLTDALNSKANSVHTHAIGDVVNLQPTLANHEQRITNLEGQGGGTVGNALKQVDLSTYSGGSNGEIVQHVGETTADYTNGYTYKCAAGEVEKTIPSGSQCIRLTQSGEEYISDGEADTTTDKMVMVLQPTAEGVTYNVFSARTIAETDIERLVGCYVPDEIGAIHTITAITHNGTTLTSVTLDNGVTLEISNSTPTKSTLAWYEYFSKSGERFYGGSGTVGYMIASKDFVSAPSGDQFYPIATEPIGTAFGGTIQTFTASEDIVIRSVTWTQSNDQPPTTVASGDNFLTITNNELGASIDIAYNSSNQHLELKGKNSAVVSYVDMSQFIVDGMLDDVQLYTTAEQGVTVEVPYLKFTFNVASGKSVIRVSLKDLVDIYDGANINLTSAFVKAATYSAPAIGDSMDVAIGKLLKGHEDNAAAIATKQDTLTFDDAPITGSNNPVKSGGIKTAIDTVAASAAQGLKCVDLTTYSGGVNGEIVKHTGADTAQYTNGYDYKLTAKEFESGDKILIVDAPYSNVKQGFDAASLISDKYFVKVANGILYHGREPMYDDDYDLYVGEKGYPAVGDTILGLPNYSTKMTPCYEVTEVVSSTYPFVVKFVKNDFERTLTINQQISCYNFTNGDGVTITLVGSWSDDYYTRGLSLYDTYHSVEVYHDGKIYEVAVGDITCALSDDLDVHEWNQHNSQPSSASDVSALQTRMTAAEAAISGKQDSLTFDNAPTANSGNVVKSGGVKSAIDFAPRFYLGTCSTAGNVAIKQVDITNFPTQLINGVETPIVGSVIAVKYQYTSEVTSSQRRIKVNNTNAYPIWYSSYEDTSVQMSTAIYGNAGKYVYYLFNGTHWVWVSHGLDFNTTYTPQSLGFGYAFCDTAASTAEKSASLLNYLIVNGGLVVVYFQYDVPAQATLNINYRGARQINFKGAKIAANVIKAGDKCLFIYNGNAYDLIAIDRWGKELQEKVSGINISETDFEALSTYEQGKLYFVYDNNS